MLVRFMLKYLNDFMPYTFWGMNVRKLRGRFNEVKLIRLIAEKSLNLRFELLRSDPQLFSPVNEDQSGVD